MAALVDGSADITANSRLLSDVAKLTSAHVRLNEYKRKVEQRVKRAADAVGALAKKGGLSDHAADQIRRKILGIAQ